jgi:hypothetical protein
MSTSIKMIMAIAGVIAIVSSLPMFEVRMVPEWFVAGALPGSLVAIMISGNVHVFNPWVVVAANWIIYVLVVLLIRKVARVFRAS